MRLLVLLPLVACEQDYEVVPKNVDVDPGDITECAFTRVEDTEFYEYDCNPVFSTTGEDWAGTIRQTAFLVTEVMDHPFYQMWYTGMELDEAEQEDDEDVEFGLGYAVSAEGTDWTASPDNPLLHEPRDRDAWDADGFDGMQAVWDPLEERYVMLYQGYDLGGESNWGFGAATSPDGVEWERIDENPVIETLPESDTTWCWPLGLTLGEVAGYTGYIAAATGALGLKCEVFRINAGDVDEWEPDEDVVLEAGEDDEFDDRGFISLSIAELDDERYMFYVGFGDWEQHDGYQSALNAYVGMAVRDDGEWEKLGRLPLHRTDEGNVSGIAANTVGNRIHLWITDSYEIDGEEQQAVGYFLFDPERAAEEDAR